MFNRSKFIILKIIRFYQRYISLLLGNNCRFVPTCSAYTYQAIERFGVFKGGFLGLKRIIKCHPFSKPKYDPVPKNKSNKNV